MTRVSGEILINLLYPGAPTAVIKTPRMIFGENGVGRRRGQSRVSEMITAGSRRLEAGVGAARPILINSSG